MKKLLLILLMGIALGSSSARAFDLAAVGAMQFTNPNVTVNGTTATGYASKAAFGFGALMDFRLVPLFADLEIGALYLPRKWSNPDGSINTLHIPVLFRVIALPVISIGGGMAYTAGLEDAANIKKSNFSLVGSIGAKFPIAPTLSFLTDFRYQIGLTNVSEVVTTDLKFKDLQILAGINFGI